MGYSMLFFKWNALYDALYDDICSCYFDNLEVQDGGAENSPSLATLCGSQGVSSIKSTSNVVRLRLLTDAAISKGGFNITYKKGE